MFLNKNLVTNFQEIVVLLSVFLISSYKILPALQQIYNNLSYIKSGLPSLDGIFEDFKNASIYDEEINLNLNLINKLSKFKKISLENINFTYENTNFKTLRGISIEIKRGEKIGITGMSGSGKSTLIHLLSGLIYPTDGKMFIDQTKLEKKMIREWRKVIGFVPQSIYLSNTSLKNTIAFGRDKTEIDEKKIFEVSSLANLNEFIESRDSINSDLGYRGAKLSGGQTQRVGIARAFYSDPAFLILDEATSSLDNLTEDEILNSVNNLYYKPTVVMVTHKINLIKNFDKIIFLENGTISEQGKFVDIYRDNKRFKELVDIEQNKQK